MPRGLSRARRTSASGRARAGCAPAPLLSHSKKSAPWKIYRIEACKEGLFRICACHVQLRQGAPYLPPICRCEVLGNMRNSQKSPICITKEACLYGKRALFVLHKSPICMAKKPCLYGKGALFLYQKSPMCKAKEPYV